MKTIVILGHRVAVAPAGDVVEAINELMEELQEGIVDDATEEEVAVWTENSGPNRGFFAFLPCINTPITKTRH